MSFSPHYIKEDISLFWEELVRCWYKGVAFPCLGRKK